MDKDIIVAEDEDVKIIFHFKVFCELLKECMSIYGNTRPVFTTDYYSIFYR